MATLAPCSAKRTAIACPIPDEPPVTRTFFRFRPGIPPRRGGVSRESIATNDPARRHLANSVVRLGDRPSRLSACRARIRSGHEAERVEHGVCPGCRRRRRGLVGEGAHRAAAASRRRGDPAAHPEPEAGGRRRPHRAARPHASRGHRGARRRGAPPPRTEHPSTAAGAARDPLRLRRGARRRLHRRSEPLERGEPWARRARRARDLRRHPWLAPARTRDPAATVATLAGGGRVGIDVARRLRRRAGGRAARADRPAMSRLPARPRGDAALREYAAIGGGRGVAMVARDGAIDWLCTPDLDSPSVFGALLDAERGGRFELRPEEPCRVERRYRPGTNVLETTFHTRGGTVRVVDVMTLGGPGLTPFRELARRVEGLAGHVRLTWRVEPRFGYAEAKTRIDRRLGLPVATAGASALAVQCWGAGESTTDHGAIGGDIDLRAGDSALIALSLSEQEPLVFSSREQVEARIDVTARTWGDWSAGHRYGGPWGDAVVRSALALKLLVHAPTGAVAAAATTSLPEDVGGERNWDYRYSWIRDSSLTMEALYIGACSDEATDFASVMTSSAGGGYGVDKSLQIMYGIGGEHDLSERELPHLRGWRDSKPVRVGNGAWDQTQLDVYGELLNVIALYREQLGELHPEIQHFAAQLADAAAANWERQDSGMWEMRGEPRHHLSSKVLCWTALDRAVQLAPHLGTYGKAEVWTAERDRIREAILERGLSEKRQAYAQSFDSDDLDAAQLLMPLVGFLPATDPRMRSTIEAIAKDLTQDGLVLRYLNNDGLNADGLEGEEGTFVICTFWLASCLAKTGEIERAEALFDQLIGYANDVGLLAEEIDTATGELLGNVPQAFSHIGLIIAASHLDRARAA